MLIFYAISMSPMTADTKMKKKICTPVLIVCAFSLSLGPKILQLLLWGRCLNSNLPNNRAGVNLKMTHLVRRLHVLTTSAPGNWTSSVIS